MSTSKWSYRGVRGVVPPEEQSVQWSVGIEAQGDRVLTAPEVVELADAVAGYAGIASGVGSTRYGAQIVVSASSRAEAIAKGTELFRAAARTAGLPDGAIVRTEAVSEDEEAADADGGGGSGGHAGGGSGGDGADR